MHERDRSGARASPGARPQQGRLLVASAVLVVAAAIGGAVFLLSNHVRAVLVSCSRSGPSAALAARIDPTPGPPAAGGSEPPNDGVPWHLALRDTFSSRTVDTSLWRRCYPWFGKSVGCTNFGNDELEWYLPSQVRVVDHVLRLVADRTPTQGLSRHSRTKLYSWRSGLVNTFGSCEFTYGYIDVVAKLPRGDGMWPALWLLQANGQWPPEIDMMEYWGNEPHLLHFTFHRTVSDAPSRVLYTADDLSAAYHSYGLDWEPGSITWYFDGRAVFRVTGRVPHKPMYLIANLAVDGAQGYTTSTSTPRSQDFEIKSMRIWQH